MVFNRFIFSENRSDRIKSHLTFWLAWYLYFGMLHAANPMLKPEAANFQRYEFAFAESFLLIIPQVIVAYLILYVVLPMYTERRKILQPIFLGIFFWVICGYLNLFMIEHLNPAILSFLLPDDLLSNTQRLPSTNRYMALLGTWKGALTGTAFLVGFHYIKQWYLKEQKNLQLMKENTEARLQLLTAQVHPHFLFNTLNNIYSQAQNESPKSSRMIMGLSDLLRYVLYEGGKPLVPLDSEVQMMLEYIDLEKIRYDNDLDLHYMISDNTKDVYIAPLLLLPLIENCFKHGTSKMLERPWISLTIEVNGTTLVMKLMNGKAKAEGTAWVRPGIGISNVRKRLELLYGGRHELQTREEEDVFVVDLRLELTEAATGINHIPQSEPAVSYV